MTSIPIGSVIVYQKSALRYVVTYESEHGPAVKGRRLRGSMVCGSPKVLLVRLAVKQ